MLTRTGMLALTLSGALTAAQAATATLARGIYWDVSSSYRPTGYSSRVDYLKENGITEVHIWLNDNEWDAGHLPRCQPFTYTDSAGTVRWTKETLVSFVRELKTANIKSVFTLSPQVQSVEYVQSLVGVDGPLTVAREEGVTDIELDLEGNWRTDRLLSPCGSGDVKKVNEELIAAIRDTNLPRDQRRPLRLVASTTAFKANSNAALLAAADVISPQLYEAKYGYTESNMKSELRSKWYQYRKPLSVALSLGCSGSNVGTKCSRNIFAKTVRYVASLAQCGLAGSRVENYVLWSESTAARLSSFGGAWLKETANKPVETTCTR